MSTFGANTGDLAQAGRTITSLGEEYKANITNIFNEIDNLGGKWSGGASEKYITTFNSYKMDLNNLGVTIENMGKALSNAAVAFDQNESDLASQAGQL